MSSCCSEEHSQLSMLSVGATQFVCDAFGSVRSFPGTGDLVFQMCRLEGAAVLQAVLCNGVSWGESL